MIEEAGGIPGFRGAYTAGSTNWLPDDAELSRASDLDVMVVVADAERDGTREKFVYRGTLLEVSYLRSERFRSAEQVLGDYHLAPSFRTTKFLFDPFDELAPLLAVVSRDYAKRRWVRCRCANARDKVLRFIRSIDADAAFADQAIGCLFAAGVTMHVLLAAGLRNPTVRARYVAVRELLGEYGRLAFHETLLDLLGAARIDAERVEYHMKRLTDAGAIEGCREMIERGYSREAMFWIAVSFCRQQKIVGMQEHGEVLADLGISTTVDIRRRCAEIEQALPRVCEVADAILAANPEIEDD